MGNLGILYLVRYSEIFLKSEFVRKRWEKKLIKNIRKIVGIPIKIKTERGRIFIFSEKEIDEKLKKVFGIVSFSRVRHCRLDELEKVVVEYCREKIGEARTFAVRVRRVGEHSFTSQQKAAELGNLVLQYFPYLTVDLNNPDFELNVEIRNQDCYIFSEVIEGAGGIPLGVEGRVVSLLSGGIDSPVAAYLIMKRGCEVFPLYFDLGVFSEGDALGRVEKVVGVLRDYQPDMQLKIVNHEDFMRKAIDVLKSEGKLNYTCLICKRRMYRIAEKYAEEVGAMGVVTGESLGQVASQTLDNLYVLTLSCKMPVYRPLIGMDKVEIERIARKIGTYEVSKTPVNCLIAPKKPVTKGRIEVVESLEGKIYD